MPMPQHLADQRARDEWNALGARLDAAALSLEEIAAADPSREDEARAARQAHMEWEQTPAENPGKARKSLRARVASQKGRGKGRGRGVEGALRIIG